MSELTENLQRIQARVRAAAERVDRDPSEVRVIAVTKTMPPARIAQAHAAGIYDFGENRVQEAMEKQTLLSSLSPQPTWHLAGHLQSNKVKTALNLFAIIHSVDSVRLAETIARLARKPVRVLLQVNVAGESSKQGFSLDGAAHGNGSQEDLHESFQRILRLPMIQVEGLMTIAPLVSDPELVRPIFRRLRAERDALNLRHLSMGMTDDFEVAIEEGATMVRIGRAIFGERG
ncbi:MAG: YggS family pyridoxal phosphate-dependent enzyme [Chloroflexota bacterium]|nr:MAG: YggS family pyridoxal phosphate-dependent enzyme [Chloroflexota bacterium]